MHSVKEAMIAREHDPQSEIHIFGMDIRAVGKNFEEYRNRAADKAGIKFIRSRVAEVSENGNHNPVIWYEDTKTRQVTSLEVDIVVLAVACEPGPAAKKLSELLEVPLNEFGFFATKTVPPLDTLRPGVFACGCAHGPMDIPESVAQASSAGRKRRQGPLALSSKTGESGQMSGNGEVTNLGKARIGVFVCHCGSNIAGLLDCEALAEYAAALPNVVYAKDNLYTCSESGIAEIQAAIKEHGLTRVVVASCSPRTHMPLFKSACAEAGLNQYLFEMANIRDQCSWVHMQERDAAQVKAMDLIRMAAAKAALLEPLEDIESSLVKKAMVLGAGVAGLSAASVLADVGVEVLLVEREAEPGGLLRRLNRIGPSNEACCRRPDGASRTGKKRSECAHLPGYRSTSVGGVVGNYEISLKSRSGVETKETVGSIIIATGAIPFKPEGMFGYDGRKVITQIELEERLRNGPPLEAKRHRHDPVRRRARSRQKLLLAHMLPYSGKKCALDQIARPGRPGAHSLPRHPDVRGGKREAALGEPGARG